MTPAPGDTIGVYRISSELGRGGMGVVYLAEDTRLGRQVAIKALPEELAQDSTRLERFEREARVLAQLNHPNVAGIHGVEEQNGARYLVLEYVEGETLADLLDKGALAPDEAIELAAQIASGVEAAHDAGVIHRDLKPGNVIITPDGKAKVLDFGLARQSEEHSSSSVSEAATLTSPAVQATTPGVILGTAAYMSPEQARGRRVDKRSDVWSFGVVLYEMLTGIGPFRGETVTDSIGAILHKDVELDRLPDGTPAAARRVLRRCLERDKNKRYRDIGDARIELLHGSRDDAVPEVPKSGGVPIGGAVMLFVAGAAIAAGIAIPLLQAPDKPKPVRKYIIASLSAEEASVGIDSNWLAISPDGERIAYMIDQVIHVRNLDSFDSRALPETKGAESVFWSPRSDAIGYRRDNAFYRVGLDGGGTIRLASVDESSRGMPVAWVRSGKIIFPADTDGLMQIDERGGEPGTFLPIDAARDVDFHGAAAIPGSDVLLAVRHPINAPYSVIATDGQTRTELFTMGDGIITKPAYCSTGHIVFQRGLFTGEIWAVRFDADKLRTTGDPFLVSPSGLTPTVSSDGTLVFAQGDIGAGGSIASFAPEGAEGAIVQELLSVPSNVFAPTISPDGTRIAFSRGEPPNVEPWVINLERGSQYPIATLDDNDASIPLAWSADGTEVACRVYNFSRGGGEQTAFFAADGSGPSRDRIAQEVAALDPSWQSMLVNGEDDEGEDAVLLQRLGGEPEATPTGLPTDASSRMSIDPKGELVAYVSNRTGDDQVYVTRFPDGQGRWPVSIDGGNFPVWNPTGDTLYFDHEKKIYRVTVTREPAPSFGQPELYFDADAAGAELGFGWSIAPNDGRIIALTAPTEDEDQEPEVTIRVIENWAEQFRPEPRR